MYLIHSCFSLQTWQVYGDRSRRGKIITKIINNNQNTSTNRLYSACRMLLITVLFHWQYQINTFTLFVAITLWQTFFGFMICYFIGKKTLHVFLKNWGVDFLSYVRCLKNSKRGFKLEAFQPQLLSPTASCPVSCADITICKAMHC